MVTVDARDQPRRAEDADAVAVTQTAASDDEHEDRDGARDTTRAQRQQLDEQPDRERGDE